MKKKFIYGKILEKIEIRKKNQKKKKGKKNTTDKVAFAKEKKMLHWRGKKKSCICFWEKKNVALKWKKTWHCIFDNNLYMLDTSQ